MKTLRLTRKDVNKVVDILSKNQVVGVPTDTLMGLMITSDSQEAFDLLVEVKNRPIDKQFPMMFSDLDMLEKYVELSNRDILLIKEFLPGKVTFIFKVKNQNKTVAARIVDNDFLIKVVRKLAKPIYLTSANKSGEKSTLKASEVLEVFDNQIAAVVMEDALGSIGSSIIDLSKEEIIILREGEITLADINDFLKKKEGVVNMRDNKIFDLIEKERLRQENNIELIASENFVSDDILEVTGSILTNKYAEGYPNRRYYGGCQFIDEIEQLAIDRLKELYNAEHANVQPHSGSQANMAVYIAILEHGDTVLGMDLSAGGHLTHGHHLNFSGKLYNFVSYSVDPATETIDYAEVLEAAKKHKPKLIVAGASAYARYIDFKKFREIADEVGAYLMVDMAHIAGMVAAGLHPDPVEYADFVTSTTHKTLRGPRGGIILCKKEHAKKIDSAVFPGTQGGPLEHVIAGKAICFYEALQPEFKDYQNQVLKNAKALSKSLEDAGFRIVSGGTDNHIVLVDVKNSIGLDGHTCELLLDKVNITCNKNMIPFDKEPAMKTSGIRVGSPAMTSRGLKEKEFELIGKLISITLKNPDNEEILENVRLEVRDLVKKFPIRK